MNLKEEIREQIMILKLAYSAGMIQEIKEHYLEPFIKLSEEMEKNWL